MSDRVTPRCHLYVPIFKKYSVMIVNHFRPIVNKYIVMTMDYIRPIVKYIVISIDCHRPIVKYIVMLVDCLRVLSIVVGRVVPGSHTVTYVGYITNQDDSIDNFVSHIY
jgi:hypothetical protein